MASLINVQTALGGFQVAPLTNPPLKVKSGTTASIKAGTLVVRDGTNAGYVAAAANGAANTALVVGIASADSTETTSVDGVVTVEAAAYMICRMKAAVPGNLTQAKCLTNRYTLSVSGGNYTVNESVTTNGFITIISFDNTTDGNCIVSIPCNGY